MAFVMSVLLRSRRSKDVSLWISPVEFGETLAGEPVYRIWHMKVSTAALLSQPSANSTKSPISDIDICYSK
jgi:hypothetical protein